MTTTGAWRTTLVQGLPSGVLPLPRAALEVLLTRFGGKMQLVHPRARVEFAPGGQKTIASVRSIDVIAQPGCALAPTLLRNAITVILHPRSLRDVVSKPLPGVILISEHMGGDWAQAFAAQRGELSRAPTFTPTLWLHPDASSVFARLLAEVVFALPPPQVALTAQVEAGAVIMPGVVIGEHVVVGANSVIGRRGFGFVPSTAGVPIALPHWGGVVLSDGASVGANCTIDAGLFAPTRLGAHAHLDSQVHLGHNVQIGAGTFVAAQSGIGGSARIGDGVRIGGQAGIADHVQIGDFARIAAKSGVVGDIAAHATVAGYPAVDKTRFFRAVARSYARPPRAGDQRRRRESDEQGDS
jgi:acetyltransferase-like isoleucine patch superfamily enzyme